MSLIISAVLFLGQILGPVEYYQSSKAIIENDLYVSLQYVDSYIDALKKNRDASELFVNSFSMFDNELEAQVRDINTINKFKLPKNDIMQMVQIQSSISSSWNSVKEIKKQLPNFLSDDDQKKRYVSALTNYRKYLKQYIYILNNNIKPNINDIKKVDDEFEKNTFNTQ